MAFSTQRYGEDPVNDFFERRRYIDEIIEKTGLKPQEIRSIHEKYREYAGESTLYYIPVTIWAEPQPYKPLRINRMTGQLYVPEKAKLVRHIRELILQDIGNASFESGFFPLHCEVMVKVHLYLPIPKAFNREMQYLSELRIHRPSVKPDLDNCSKIVNDSIKQFIINDDAQIVTEIYEKFYSVRPRMEVVVIYSQASGIIPVAGKQIKERKERWNRDQTPDRRRTELSRLHRFYSSSMAHTPHG